jgi:hypothetical protein
LLAVLLPLVLLLALLSKTLVLLLVLHAVAC